MVGLVHFSNNDVVEITEIESWDDVEILHLANGDIVRMSPLSVWAESLVGGSGWIESITLNGVRVYSYEQEYG